MLFKNTLPVSEYYIVGETQYVKSIVRLNSQYS